MKAFGKPSCLALTLWVLGIVGFAGGCDSSSTSNESRVKRLTPAQGSTGTSGSLSRHVTDLAGTPIDPFAAACSCRVLVFITTDCPIANRYAPKLQRMADDFAKRGVVFHLVYPNVDDTADDIRKHLSDYGFECKALRDVNHVLVERVDAHVTPEAAVFDSNNKLVYCGRIDNWYVDFGKNRPTPTEHNLKEAVEAVLAGQAIKKPRVKAVGCYIVGRE